MAYEPTSYAILKPKDLARRLDNLEPLVRMYMAKHTNLSNAMRNIEEGELILKKLKERIDYCTKDMYDIANKYANSRTPEEIMKAVLYYGPILSDSNKEYSNIKLAMEDLVYGGRLLAELREKLEDLALDMANINIAMEMQDDM